MEAVTDLVPTGILEGGRFSGVLPAMVVSSLLIPSVLSTPRASEDPLKSNLPVLMSHGSAPCFIVFASENNAQRNYPHHLLVSD